MGFILVINNYPDLLSIPVLTDYDYIKTRNGMGSLCNVHWRPGNTVQILCPSLMLVLPHCNIISCKDHWHDARWQHLHGTLHSQWNIE
jgi:hypothetical protein